MSVAISIKCQWIVKNCGMARAIKMYVNIKQQTVIMVWNFRNGWPSPEFIGTVSQIT